MRSVIKDVFLDVYKREVGGDSAPQVEDDSVLLETGLDSMGFAVLVVELEETLGFDPFSLASEPFYPRTFGEFVRFYEQNQP